MASLPFAERLSLELRRKKITLREVGAAMGVSAQAVHHWTHGGGITPENVRKLSRILGVSPAALFFGLDDASLTSEERSVLDRFRDMGEDEKRTVMDFIEFQSRRSAPRDVEQFGVRSRRDLEK